MVKQEVRTIRCGEYRGRGSRSLFAFRLDFDLDGEEGFAAATRSSVKRLPEKSFGEGRACGWLSREIPRTEQQAKLQMSMEKPEIWRVINPGVRVRLAIQWATRLCRVTTRCRCFRRTYPAAEARGIHGLSVVGDALCRGRTLRGRRLSKSEPDGEGLPAWTKVNRGIEDTYIAYLVHDGISPRAVCPGWPVMPTAWHEFELRPYNFFNRNAALDLPKLTPSAEIARLQTFPRDMAEIGI